MAKETKLWLYGRVLAAMLALAALPVAPARADDVDEQARARYQRAIALYDDGVYDAALVELRRAYELRPSYKLLYNIGQVRLAMRDYAGALETFQQYLREGGGKVPSSRREAVQRELANLEQRVGHLSIRVDYDGAEVLIDDAPVGKSPLPGPVLVSSGLRRITAVHPERPPQTLRVSIAGGERQDVSLVLGVPPAAIASAPPPPAASVAASVPLTAPPSVAPQPLPAKPAGPTRYAPWVGWSTTGALGLTAIGLAIGAHLKDAKLADARGQVGSSAGDKARELDGLKQQTERLALATDVLFGATAVAAGVSLWLSLREHGKPDARGDAPTTTRVALGPSSLHLRTEF